MLKIYRKFFSFCGENSRKFYISLVYGVILAFMEAMKIPAIMLMVDFILFDNIRGALQVFDIPFVITGGGPGYASSTFTLYTIKTAFTFSNFGLASTMAVAIMVMIVVIYVIQNKLIHGLILKEDK